MTAHSLEDWFQPYYMLLLHANFMYLPPEEQGAFVAALQTALNNVDAQVVERLLTVQWRSRLTGAWFAGLKGWDQFTERIGDLLIESGAPYQGQSFCFALARFATEQSVAYLTSYLDEYLPQTDHEWDQDWAMGALMWIDEIRGTNHARTYLHPGGLWEQFAADKLPYFKRWHLSWVHERFRSIMQFCQQTFPK